MDYSGLANQTHNVAKMLKPDKVLLIDSSTFNDFKQRPELYDNFKTDKVLGFPTRRQYMTWLKGLTHVFTCETFYNDYVTNYTLRMGIKTYIQPNYEFSDFFVKNMTRPTMFLLPTGWHKQDFDNKEYDNIVLRPPLFENDFKKVRESNVSRRYKRFLHIVGKQASMDRNGTTAVLEALKHTDSDFELVIKSQYEIPIQTDDKRVTYDFTNVHDHTELYKDFDALILPRRYGGLCLPMNEGLMSGLPVIMTDMSPNNELLPDKWLVKAKLTDKLQARTKIDVYTANSKELARKIDEFCDKPDSKLTDEKVQALDIALENFSADKLRSEYLHLCE